MQLLRPILVVVCTVLFGCAPAWTLPTDPIGSIRQNIDVADETPWPPFSPKRFINHFPHRTDFPKRDFDYQARVRTRYMPNLPAGLSAMDSRLEIWLIVEADSTAREMVVTETSGNIVIDDLYLAAMRDWTYSSALINGRPVPQQVRQVFHIQIK